MTGTCECIASVNEELAQQGLELDVAICFSRTANRMDLRTYTPLMRKDNGRRETRSSKPRVMAHNFCPFCGLALDAEPAAPPDQAD